MSRRRTKPRLSHQKLIELAFRAMPEETRNWDDAGMLVLCKPHWWVIWWIKTQIGHSLTEAVIRGQIPIEEITYETCDEVLAQYEHLQPKLDPVQIH